MRCSKCGTEGIPGKKFCAECGNPLSKRCSKCNSDNAPGAKFCADCGSALGTDVVTEDGKPSAAEADGGVRIAPTRQTSETIDGERKTVTALLADIGCEGNCCYYARTKGVDASAEAESLFRQAIQIAQKQRAKSLELRSTISLARLLEKQGRRDEARVMPAEIYRWFTEGFDTADLKTQRRCSTS
jgi:hypothetical protein